MCVHPVFHVSLLSKYRADTIPGRVQEPPLPVIINDQLEWEVTQILNSQYKRHKLYYTVQRTGYGQEEENEQPCENLENAQELVDEYHRRFPDAPGPEPREPQPVPPPPAPPRPRQTRNSRRLRTGQL